MAVYFDNINTTHACYTVGDINFKGVKYAQKLNTVDNDSVEISSQNSADSNGKKKKSTAKKICITALVGAIVFAIGDLIACDGKHLKKIYEYFFKKGKNKPTGGNAGNTGATGGRGTGNAGGNAGSTGATGGRGTGNAGGNAGNTGATGGRGAGNAGGNAGNTGATGGRGAGNAGGNAGNTGSTGGRGAGNAGGNAGNTGATGGRGTGNTGGVGGSAATAARMRFNSNWNDQFVKDLEEVSQKVASSNFSTSQLSSDDISKIAKILEIEKDEVLQISKNKRLRNKLSMKFHPDLHQNESEEVKTILKQIQTIINCFSQKR